MESRSRAGFTGAGWEGSVLGGREDTGGLGRMMSGPRGAEGQLDDGDGDEDRGKFYLVVNGTIEGCTCASASYLYAKFRFERGRDWDMLRLGCDAESLQEGVTQVSEMMGGPVPFFAWNMPFSVAMASSNPHGWPKLVLSVHDVESNDSSSPPFGYGWCHVPTRPGRYEVDVPLFRPVAASPIASLTAWIRGFRFRFTELPEFRGGAVWSSGEHREVTKVEGAGAVVRVVFHVLTKNMALHGFSLGSTPAAASF
eukprot:Hpha_TRINITY_DN23804_c0_g1::TRINITY_DN23804_c0_g1_i1::g.109791::m.109791/K16744/B9D1; B9 domain-containing protein 1